MATYTLHLGFDWNSSLIGSLWGSGNNETYRFLQYALADRSGNPGWFHFTEDDMLEVFLWDLTTSSSPTRSLNTLNLGFSDLDSATAYPPGALVQVEQSGWALKTGSKGWQYLQAQAANFQSLGSSPSCPWGDGRNYPCYQVNGLVKFKYNQTNYQYKLSFYLEVESGDDPRFFISDPEVIVGSKGT